MFSFNKCACLVMKLIEFVLACYVLLVCSYFMQPSVNMECYDKMVILENNLLLSKIYSKTEWIHLENYVIKKFLNKHMWCNYN